ncbi:MAG: hypothetical protein ABF277_06845 [Candidatus Arcticimaribacter sp.]
MFLIQHLTHYFTRYYLLAATASIIILGFIGSANVLFITAMNPSIIGWVGLFFTVMATMRFLAFFLAQYPKKRVIESFISGVIVQLIILILVLLN